MTKTAPNWSASEHAHLRYCVWCWFGDAFVVILFVMAPLQFRVVLVVSLIVSHFFDCFQLVNSNILQYLSPLCIYLLVICFCLNLRFICNFCLFVLSFVCFMLFYRLCVTFWSTPQQWLAVITTTIFDHLTSSYLLKMPLLCNFLLRCFFNVFLLYPLNLPLSPLASLIFLACKVLFHSTYFYLLFFF